jgi:hypothetical protein
MKIKLAATILLLLAIPFSPVTSVSQSSTSERQTVWKVVNNSLSELLDNGWKLLDQSISRVATNPAPGISGVDSTIISYTLAKNGKHVTCVVYNPRSTEATYSKCFWIN